MGILRLFLAICVYFEHSAPILPFSMPSGTLAVQVFFAISGFYIALVWNNKYSKMKSGTQIFWLNRWLRLAPAFFIVGLLVVLEAKFTAGTFRGLNNLTPLQILGIATSQLFLFGQELFSFAIYNTQAHTLDFTIHGLATLDPKDVFIPGWYLQPIPQGWSIGLEALFYAFAPFLAGAKVRTLLIWSILSSVCAIVLSPLSSRALDYRFFPVELQYFIAGILIYHLYTHPSQTLQKILNNKPLGWILTGVIIVWGAIVHTLVPDVALSIYFFSVVICIPSLFSVFKNSKWDNWIGSLSFPFYIVHLYFIGQFPRNPWLDLASALVASILLVYLIEKPMDRVRYRWTERRSKNLIPLDRI